MRKLEPDTCAEIQAFFEENGPELPEESLLSEPVREHLASCTSCREEWELRKEIRALLQEDMVSAPPELKERVLTEVHGVRQEKKRRFIPIGTIAAALLVLAVVGIVRFGPSGLSRDAAYADAPSAWKAAEPEGVPQEMDPEAQDADDPAISDPGLSSAEYAVSPDEAFAFLAECATDEICTRIYVFEDEDSCPAEVSEWIGKPEARLFLPPASAYRAVYTVPVTEVDISKLESCASEVLRYTVLNGAEPTERIPVVGVLFLK